MIDIKWPSHKCGLHLSHNRHKDYYQTVAQAIEAVAHGYRDHDWVSEEQKQKATATNDCWTLQWYPDTPTAFCLMSAADLDVLIECSTLKEDERKSFLEGMAEAQEALRRELDQAERARLGMFPNITMLETWLAGGSNA